MSPAEIRRGDVWWVRLDPAQGSEIRKTRPCVVLTHDTINRLRETVVVVPLSAAAGPHPPITVPVTCGREASVAVIDQVRAVAKHRLESQLGSMSDADLDAVCAALRTILRMT